jgi:hypothetical protein
VFCNLPITKHLKKTYDGTRPFLRHPNHYASHPHEYTFESSQLSLAWTFQAWDHTYPKTRACIDSYPHWQTKEWDHRVVHRERKASRYDRAPLRKSQQRSVGLCSWAILILPRWPFGIKLMLLLLSFSENKYGWMEGRMVDWLDGSYFLFGLELNCFFPLKSIMHHAAFIINNKIGVHK